MEGGINSGLAGRFLIRLASETGRREYAEVISESSSDPILPVSMLFRTEA